MRFQYSSRDDLPVQDVSNDAIAGMYQTYEPRDSNYKEGVLIDD